MTRGELNSRFNHLIGELSAKLASQGFVQRLQTLRVKTGGNAALINFQKSDQSSETRLVFTVNLGVVCGALPGVGERGLEDAGISESHLRTRLGMLLDSPGDKWWELTDSTNLKTLCDELFDAITRKALPYLNAYLQTEALIELWRSGKSPGMTAKQRARVLSQLGVESGG